MSKSVKTPCKIYILWTKCKVLFGGKAVIMGVREQENIVWTIWNRYLRNRNPQVWGSTPHVGSNKKNHFAGLCETGIFYLLVLQVPTYLYLRYYCDFYTCFSSYSFWRFIKFLKNFFVFYFFYQVSVFFISFLWPTLCCIYFPVKLW